MIKYLPNMFKALKMIPQHDINQVWYHRAVIPTLGRWRPGDQKFKVTLSDGEFEATVLETRKKEGRKEVEK